MIGLCSRTIAFALYVNFYCSFDIIKYCSWCMFTHIQFIMTNKSKFWLILPVVICLSQRLSHACLSTNENKVKPQKAHYISYGFLDRIHNYLDNCGNSRANTCI